MPHIHARPNLVPYIAAFLVLAMAACGPIAQPDNYHHFADQRSLFGVTNAGDVLSNLGFLLVGGFGLLRWRGTEARVAGHGGYGVFFAALALTAAGSAWYHLAPDDARLALDRLPIALACAALLAAELERASKAGWLIPLCVFGAASVGFWSLTGDLRPYLLIQLAPLVLIPALHWQLRASMARRIAFVVAIALYVIAKMFELADATAMSALQAISGHTLKHLLATAAAAVLVWQFTWPVTGDQG